LRYTIKFKKPAVKALRKLPRSAQKRIAGKINSMEENLPSPETTKMEGNNSFHKVRVGDYRIIYEIQNDVLIILIVKIGNRKDVYRHLS
jgi:mRNA interferase RelE/StbE